MTETAPTEPQAKPPSLAGIITRIAARLDADAFPTGDRAALRRLDPAGSPSLTFYRFAFRELPEGWQGRQPPWMTLIAGIALTCPGPHQPKRRLGQVLAETGYAESRLERLLAAEGDTLHTLVLRAARFLGAKNAACNWTDFAYLLGLGGDPERARLGIARAYYRNIKEKD